MADNSSAVILASAARTATINGADQDNLQFKGVHVVIDVTAIVTTPSITVKIQGLDELSSKYYDILTSSAITTVSTTTLVVYPGITETANVKESDFLPRKWRVRVEHLDADSITYSVGANLLV